MGRQDKDTAVVGSSIALLQERFKHLQRLKEMREERELLKSLPQSTDHSYDEAKKAGMQISALEDPLVLGLNSSPHYRIAEPREFPSAVRRSHNFFDKHDVDTSLRL